jgi:hypothetical protein
MVLMLAPPLLRRLSERNLPQFFLKPLATLPSPELHLNLRVLRVLELKRLKAVRRLPAPRLNFLLRPNPGLIHLKAKAKATLTSPSPPVKISEGENT